MTTRLKAALGVERLTDQFDAFKVAAKILVARTQSRGGIGVRDGLEINLAYGANL